MCRIRSLTFSESFTDRGEFCPDEIKGEAGKVKVRGIFHYRILYIGEGAGHMPELLEGSIPVDEVVFLNDLEGRRSGGFPLESGKTSMHRRFIPARQI